MAKPELFELSNGTITARLTNAGATITSLLVPDSQGNIADVVLGFDSLDTYVNDNAPYFGCIVGRVANRIKDGKFTLNGTEYFLAISNGPYSLHGGNKGFNKVLWEFVGHEDGQNPAIIFKYISKDGEEGYPGDLTVTATYSLPSSNSLRLVMEATPNDKSTPVNLAQHTYWNLAGHNSGDVLDHLIQISGRHITAVDANTLPTGDFVPVENTPFDFTQEKTIRSRIDQVPGGYDHNYVLDCGAAKSGLKHVAKVKDPSSSRVLNLWTDAPGVQFYTGNYVHNVPGKEGAMYQIHAGLCLETQGFPDAVNQPHFPNIVIHPGDKYTHTMLFDFSAD
ncbi:hypothetical protein KSP40_PGU004569 [Platanthera guangdongensis]|uniref:Aldose 1-epimerase n=1 Tax=Platanthera guangdongensis TaxID=2320717 RepID=A0ABR2MBV0_9ASPA